MQHKNSLCLVLLQNARFPYVVQLSWFHPRKIEPRFGPSRFWQFMQGSVEFTESGGLFGPHMKQTVIRNCCISLLAFLRPSIDRHHAVKVDLSSAKLSDLQAKEEKTSCRLSTLERHGIYPCSLSTHYAFFALAALQHARENPAAV